MLLSVKFITRISVNVAIIDAGIASAEISTARMLRMKNTTISEARRLPQNRCSSSDSTEALMKSESSLVMTRLTPFGSVR